MIYKYLIFSLFLVINNICFSADKKFDDEIDLNPNKKFIKVKVNVQRQSPIGCDCDNHSFNWFFEINSPIKVVVLKSRILNKIKNHEYEKMKKKGYLNKEGYFLKDNNIYIFGYSNFDLFKVDNKNEYKSLLNSWFKISDKSLLITNQNIDFNEDCYLECTVFMGWSVSKQH